MKKKTDAEILREIFGGNDAYAQYFLKEAFKKVHQRMAFELRVRIEEIERRVKNGESLQIIEEIALKKFPQFPG